MVEIVDVSAKTALLAGLDFPFNIGFVVMLRPDSFWGNVGYPFVMARAVAGVKQALLNEPAEALSGANEDGDAKWLRDYAASDGGRESMLGRLFSRTRIICFTLRDLERASPDGLPVVVVDEDEPCAVRDEKGNVKWLAGHREVRAPDKVALHAKMVANRSLGNTSAFTAG